MVLCLRHNKMRLTRIYISLSRVSNATMIFPAISFQKVRRPKLCRRCGFLRYYKLRFQNTYVIEMDLLVKQTAVFFILKYTVYQYTVLSSSIPFFLSSNSKFCVFRALKDPNQLIRANALRVLSSIRVSVIVPIMMLAIKDSTNDMSPYVRKTAALAIPKLYSLDDEQKDQLVEVIEKLLADKTTLVIGSAVMAFEEVCPERIDLIHKNYRRLCQVLIDLEEWGQVVVINMLTRYARTQFADPNGKDLGESGESSEEFQTYWPQ